MLPEVGRPWKVSTRNGIDSITHRDGDYRVRGVIGRIIILDRLNTRRPNV